ncbi:hypothetical protein ACTXT7_005628 [Hymenolepis weldensis]
MSQLQEIAEIRQLGDYNIEMTVDEVPSISEDKTSSPYDGECKSNNDIKENLYKTPDCAESRFNHDSILRIQDILFVMTISNQPQNVFKRAVLNFLLENGVTVSISMHPSTALNRAISKLSRQTGISAHRLKFQAHGKMIFYKTKFCECAEKYEEQVKVIVLS